MEGPGFHQSIKFSANMKVLVLFSSILLWWLNTAQDADPTDLEPLDKVDEKEFEEFYHLAPVDSSEYERRSAALEKNEMMNTLLEISPGLMP